MVIHLLQRLILPYLLVYILFSCSTTAASSEEEIPLKSKLLNDIGGYFYDKDQYLEAKAYFSMAVKMSPGYADALVNRAAVYNALGQYQDAVNDATQALKIAPNSVSAYNNRANAYAALGKYSQALEDYKNSYRLSPGFLDVVFNIANLYYRLNLRLDAVRYYTRALEIHPGLTQAYIFRATALYELGYTKRSDEDFNTVMQMKARSPQINILLAQSLIQVKRFQDAEKILTAMLAEKETAEAFAARAEAFYYQKKYTAAKDDITRAVEIRNNVAYQALRMKIEKALSKK